MKRIGVVIAIVAVALLGAAGALAWVMGVFEKGPEGERVTEAKEQRKRATIDDALELIHKARDRFAGVKDHQCIYLRDEMIGNDMKKNHLILSVRNEPFSVCMEYVSPHKGRKAIYVHGKNDNQIMLENVPLMKKIDPDGVFAKTQSRHRITEAGLQKTIDRFCERWAAEKKLGQTEVLIQDVDLKVALPEGERIRPCRLVTTIHNPKDKDSGHYLFYRTYVYFDKETGLPARMQGFDWPRDAQDKEGRLIEDYTYLDVKTNVGLKDAHFEVKK